MLLLAGLLPFGIKTTARAESPPTPDGFEAVDIAVTSRREAGTIKGYLARPKVQAGVRTSISIEDCVNLRAPFSDFRK